MHAHPRGDHLLRTLAPWGLALSAIATLGGCAQHASHVAVERIVVCAGVDDQHPAGTPVRVTLRQGGRQVAAVMTQRGALVAVLVPEAPTAVLTDGTLTGQAGWSGKGYADAGPAPDAATLRAVAATDPADVKGYIGLTGPGCPPASDVPLG